MTSRTPDPSALLGRIERLERANRRLWLALAAVLLAGMAGLLVGLAPAATRVEAEVFELKDARGVVRGAWTSGPGGQTYLSLNAPSGKPRLRMTLERGEYPRLELFDRKDRPRAVLAAFPSGHLGLSLHGENGKPRTSLYLDDKDAPKLSLLDSRGVTRLGLGVLGDETPHISLQDPKKRTVASFYADPGGEARLELYRKLQATLRLAVSPRGARGIVLFDDKGRPLMGLGIDTADTANLRIFNAAGKVLFKAP